MGNLHLMVAATVVWVLKYAPPAPGFEINFKNPLQASMPPFRSRGSTEAVTDEAFICLTLQSLKPLRQANHW